MVLKQDILKRFVILNIIICNSNSRAVRIIRTPWSEVGEKVINVKDFNSETLEEAELSKFNISNKVNIISKKERTRRNLEPTKFTKELEENFVKLITRKSGEDDSIIKTMKKLYSEISQIKIMTNNIIAENNSFLGSQLDENLKNILIELNNLMKNAHSNPIDVKKPIRNYRNIERKKHVNTHQHLSEMIYEFKRALRDKSTKCDCKSSRTYESFPGDCHEIMNLGFNVSGIYKIRPEDFDPFYVLCDMDSAGGGWTVFQNRYDGSQDFYKPWNEYKYGFGNLAGEFWLGLEKLHFLSNQKLYALRVDMQSHYGEEVYAGYTVFSIGSEIEAYRISAMGSYYGKAGDSMSYHSGQKFSTYDNDNDDWTDGTCAEEHGGAWWYRECDRCNLNGRYSVKDDDETKWQGIYWNTFKGPTHYLSRTRMMLRPLPISHTEAEPPTTYQPKTSKTKNWNWKDYRSKFKTHKALGSKGKSASMPHSNDATGEEKPWEDGKMPSWNDNIEKH